MEAKPQDLLSKKQKLNVTSAYILIFQLNVTYIYISYFSSGNLKTFRFRD